MREHEERVQHAWHDQEHEQRLDAAWHGHDHDRLPPVPAAEPGLDDLTSGPASRRPSPGVIAGVACLLVGFAMIAVSLAEPAPEARTLAETTTTTTEAPLAVPLASTGTTAPLDGAALGEGFADPQRGRTPLRGFGEVQVTITSGTGEQCVVCLLSATTDEQRARGLMEVTDPTLGGYDGMLFEFPSEVAGAFWMRNTPLPLSIAYFDDQGRLVSTTDMQPCEDRADCPSYPAEAPFAFALEVPQGMLEEIDVAGAATLAIDARTCEEAGEGS